MDFMLVLEGIAILFLYNSQVFRIPSIVSFLVIGMLAGPYGFALITDESSIETVGEIGIMLLFCTRKNRQVHHMCTTV
jgi:CPA2 family monovalent cation:H+ antiporter-2